MKPNLSKCCNALAKYDIDCEMSTNYFYVCTNCGESCEVVEKPCPKCHGTGTYLDPNGRTAGDCPICRPYPHELPASGLLSIQEWAKVTGLSVDAEYMYNAALPELKAQQAKTTAEKEKEIAELKDQADTDHDQLMLVVKTLASKIHRFQSSHQAKLKELFQEIEMNHQATQLGANCVFMTADEYKSFKSKYLQGK